MGGWDVRDLAFAQNGHFVGCRRSEPAFLRGVPSQAVLEICFMHQGEGVVSSGGGLSESEAKS
jgi:hypothetical protein